MVLFVCGTQSFCSSLLVNPLSRFLIRRHSPTALIVFVILLGNKERKRGKKKNPLRVARMKPSSHVGNSHNPREV